MSDEINEALPPENYKQEENWTLGPKEFIFKYLRYLPWIVISAGLFLTLAYMKVRYTTQIFRTSSSLLIKSDRADHGGGSKDEKLDELFLNQSEANLANETEILRSNYVMQRVARDLNLQTYYYNKGKVRATLLYPITPVELKVAKLADSTQGFSFLITVLNDSQFTINEGKTAVRFGESFQIGDNYVQVLRNRENSLQSYTRNQFLIGWQPLSEAAASLAGNLRVAHVNTESTILNLSFDDENSDLGRDVLNTLMNVYDTLIVEDMNRIATNTLRFVDDRLEGLKQDLGSVEGNLKNYMVNNQAFDLEGQAKSYQDNMSEATKQQVQGAVQMNIVDWLLAYIHDDKNIYNTVPTNLGIQEPALVQLMSEYNRLELEREANLKTTPARNPLIVGMDSTLEKIRKNIYQALLNVKQAYVIEQSHVDEQQRNFKDQLQSLPGKSMQMLNIQRQQKIFEELYSFLLQKRLETSISSASTISNSRVIEPATSPGVLVSPDPKNTYVLFLMLGLALPVGIIALLEVMRDKVAHRGDIEKRTSTPILGEIGHSGKDQPLVVSKNSRRFIAEQFRIIRTNLQYIINKKEKPVIMVTSSFSGEGKSFISTNMGAVMALTGKSTVIMEFDIRKPKIVSGLELKRKIGITNYIIGRGTFDELLIKVEEVDNLYVIPCGPIPPNPSELLLDPRLNELMAEAKARFDVVIMDTAPVGLVSDAINLGRFADCTVYIVRQGYTFRKQINMIEELHASKKLPGLALLLNDVKVESGYYSGGYHGGYGYYGGYSYGNDAGYFDQEKRKGNIFIRMWKQLFP